MQTFRVKNGNHHNLRHDGERTTVPVRIGSPPPKAFCIGPTPRPMALVRPRHIGRKEKSAHDPFKMDHARLVGENPASCEETDYGENDCYDHLRREIPEMRVLNERIEKRHIQDK
jgi:hypothetical protein